MKKKLTIKFSAYRDSLGVIVLHPLILHFPNFIFLSWLDKNEILHNLDVQTTLHVLICGHPLTFTVIPLLQPLYKLASQFSLKHSVYNERKLQCATIYCFRARIFVTQTLLLWYPVFLYLWSQLCFFPLWRILLLTERKVPLTSMVYSVWGFSKIIASWTSYW